MAFKVGSGSVCQAAKQTTWGTPVAPTVLLNMTGESINTQINKGDEGNLIASKTAGQRDTLSIVVDGGIDTILRPEFADWLFEMALGKVSTGVYTLQDPNVQLPFSTVLMGRGGIYKTYPDMTVRRLEIQAPAQDYVRANIDFVGSKEIAAGETGAQTPASLSYTLPSYRCTKATLLYGAGGTAASSLVSSLCIESCTITIDNGVEDSPATYCSGLYNERPIPGLRSVLVSCTIPYSDDLDSFRDTYFSDDTSPCVALKLQFTTSNADEKIDIYLPNVNLTAAGGNVSGPGIIDGSFEGEALSIGSTEPITITVTHDS